MVKKKIKNKMKVKKIPINKLQDWSVKIMEIFSQIFTIFSVEGVKINSAVEREVKKWINQY